MRSSCIVKSNRQQSFPSWVLLAGCSRGSRALGEVLQRLSDVQSKKSSTSISTENDSNRMAVCSMGTGHGDPFKRARSGMTHLLVAVDKFTKWIEARPIKKLDGPTAVRFVADLVCRYGVPNSIITDNGTNFVKGALARYASQQGIRLDLASVAHPQSNGQVERANGLILSGIRPRLVEPLERAPGAWIDELPAVLFSLRTTPNRSTGFTPFFLVYGSEAVIPSDIEFDSPRHALYTEEEARLAREDG